MRLRILGLAMALTRFNALYLICHEIRRSRPLSDSGRSTLVHVVCPRVDAYSQSWPHVRVRRANFVSCLFRDCSALMLGCLLAR